MIRYHFVIAPLGYDLKHFNYFLNPEKGDWDWSKYVLNAHPELKRLKKGNKFGKSNIRKYLIKFREDNHNILESKKEEFEKFFNAKSDVLLKNLLNLLQLKETKINEIMILISTCPINPRNIKKKEFSVYYNFPSEDMFAIAMHEILHFVYFEKWEEVFPESNEESFDGPHIIWHLSEIVAPILLNSNELQNVLKYNHRGYSEYDKLKFGNRDIGDIIKDFYKESNNFEDFLKKAYKFVLENKEKIQSI